MPEAVRLYLKDIHEHGAQEALKERKKREANEKRQRMILESEQHATRAKNHAGAGGREQQERC